MLRAQPAPYIDRSRSLGQLEDILILAGDVAKDREIKEFHFHCTPARPIRSAISTSAPRRNVMCSSRSTPNSAAPLTMSSRLTLRANALSFSFFFTDAGFTSTIDLLGCTSAQAVRNPHSSSHAK